MGIGAIVKDLGGAVSNTLSLFGVGASERHPAEIGNRVSNFIQENDQSWRKSLGYAFSVVRVSASGKSSIADGWQEFVLQINPQELSQDEIFAIEVTPTFSGVLVEHQGTTLKDINISGTTGLSPNRREGGAFPHNGRPVFAAGHSGYKEFHDLRTYIRSYVEQKRDDDGRDKGELRLVWRNLRDKEDLFVEPQKFSMKRSSSKPHLYDYSIQLKGIGIARELGKTGSSLALIDDFLEDVQDGLDSGLKVIEGSIGFVSRVQRDIESLVLGPIRTYSAALRTRNTSKRSFKSASQMIKDLEKKVNKDLDVAKKGSDANTKAKVEKLKDEELKKLIKEAGLSPTGSKIDASVKSASESLTKENLKKTLENITKVYDNIADFVGIDSGIYSEIKGYVSTLKGSATVDYDQIKVLNALSAFKVSMYKLLQDNKLFVPTAKKDIDTINAVMANAKSAKSASASLKAKKNEEAKLLSAKLSGDAVAASQAQKALDLIANDEASKKGKLDLAAKKINADYKIAKTVEILGGMTIQTLAAKEMGDPDKYKELVMYNNLKPPYIDTTGTSTSPYVLKPGDKIQIPITSTPKSPKNVTSGFPAPINKNLDAVQKSFGVDFKLTDEFDLDVNSYGDINLLASSENVAQRIILKLLLDEGSLKRHPEIGVGLAVGIKSTLDLTGLVDRIRTSLSSDSSIEKVIYADVVQEGSSLTINLILKLRNVDQPLTFPVKVA